MTNKTQLRLLLTMFTFSWLVSSCAGTFHQPHANGITNSQHQVDKTDALATDLAAMTWQADAKEAARLAKTAITYSSYLAKRYRVVRPAVFHNILVQMGLKDRGLCYHWADDLMAQLKKLGLKTFQLHMGVAYQGSVLKEHNSIVITGMNQDFSQGLVLDPWRHSGDLFWVAVKTDTYPWQKRGMD